MDEHDTVVPSSRRVVGLLLPGELSFSTPGRGGTGPPSLVFFMDTTETTTAVE